MLVDRHTRLQDNASRTRVPSPAPQVAPFGHRRGERDDQQDPRQERTTPDRASERLRFCPEPDIEDQHDHEERRIRRRSSGLCAAKARGRSITAAVRPRNRPSLSEDHHRDEGAYPATGGGSTAVAASIEPGKGCSGACQHGPDRANCRRVVHAFPSGGSLADRAQYRTLRAT